MSSVRFFPSFNSWSKSALWAVCVGIGLAGLLGSPASAQEKDKEPLTANEAQKILLLEDHLKNISKPVTLRYNFERKAAKDDSFTDVIDMKIDKVRDDGAKDISFEFFTGDRRKPYPDLSNFRTNALFMVSITRDIWVMARASGGHAQQANYLGKKINIAIRENAKMEEITIDTANGPLKATKITVSPFAGDANIQRFKQFEHKVYEFVIAKDIPGQLYSVHTVVPRGKSDKDGTGPLIEETTKFDVKK